MMLENLTDGILLYSGGLDSYCLWWLTGKPACVYVDLGHRYAHHERREINRMWVHATGPQVTMLDAPWGGRHEAIDGHIPYRNLLLVTAVAVAYPHRHPIILGALCGEVSRDKSPRFLQTATGLLRYLEPTEQAVVAPARHLTKSGLVARFLQSRPGVRRVVAMLATRSCYSAHHDRHCGECQACFRRWVALVNNDLPTDDFATDPRRHPAARDARIWWRGLRQADPLCLPDILRNNLEAYRALRKVNRCSTA
jgi:7-cyano-7-deazaguanine synthase in queuosine biosynthesis